MRDRVAERAFHGLLEQAEGVQTRREFGALALETLARMVGHDSATLSPVGAPPAFRNKAGYQHLARQLVEQPARYEPGWLPGRRAASLQGGTYIDTDVYSACERDSLPFYTDLIRPQRIRVMLVGEPSFRGQRVGTFYLCRHGSGRRFRPIDLERVRSLIPALGLAQTALFGVALSATRRGSGSISPREHQIAGYVGLGLRNHEIAKLMGTSPHTVRNQLHRVFEKLGLGNRAELAAWYERLAPVRSAQRPSG